MNPTLDFMKKYWYIPTMLVMMVACFAFGWYSVPKPEVKIQEKIVTQTVTKEVRVVDEQLVEQEVSKRVAEFEKTLKTHTVTVVVTKKDGTKVEKTTQDTDSDTKSKTETDQTKQQVITVHDVQTVTVEKQVIKEVKVEVKSPQPAWMVGIEAGTTVESLKGLPPLYLGLSASHRFIGPIFLGASAGVTLDPATGKPRGVGVKGFAGVEF